MGGEPIGAGAVIDHDGHVVGQGQGVRAWRRRAGGRRVRLVAVEVEDEFVVDLEQHAGLVVIGRVASASMRIMASLIMSAAVPWMGVLMAVRSALPRMVWLAEARSGR